MPASGTCSAASASRADATPATTMNATISAPMRADDEEAAGRPAHDVALGRVREDPGERDVDRTVELADRPDDADDPDDRGQTRRLASAPSSAPSISSASGGNASIRPGRPGSDGLSLAMRAGDAEHQQRGRDRGEQRRERQAVRQQPAGGAAVDVEDAP